MARTNTQNVPDELRSLFNKSLEQRDRFILGVVQGHKRLPSRRQARELKRARVLVAPDETIAEYGLAIYGETEFGLI